MLPNDRDRDHGVVGLDDVEQFHPATVTEWRAWLADHHATSPAVWLVTWRKGAGHQIVGYDEAVTEALAFGWVDSRPRALDDKRTMLYFTPRKPGSAWSRPNKQRVQRLLDENRMAPAGQTVIDAAMVDGSWTVLDDVEDLVEPDDLRIALDGVAGARASWDAFPRSAKRGILEWIVQAKRPATRTARVVETAAAAGRGERANQWVRKG